MKLYLSSYKLGNSVGKLQSMAANKTLAIISNSRDAAEDQEYRQSAELQQLTELASLGLKAEILDLRQYFGKSESLRRDMEKFGGVWVLGGNTFVLRSAMEQCEFDQIIREYAHRKDKNDFVYAGYSAGICLLAETLKGIDLMDEPEKAEQVYGKPVVWEGLGIIKFSVVPHYQSDHPETELANKAVKYFEEHQMPYRTLKDGEVIIDSTLE